MAPHEIDAGKHRAKNTRSNPLFASRLFTQALFFYIWTTCLRRQTRLSQPKEAWTRLFQPPLLVGSQPESCSLHAPRQREAVAPLLARKRSPRSDLDAPAAPPNPKRFTGAFLPVLDIALPLRPPIHSGFARFCSPFCSPSSPFIPLLPLKTVFFAFFRLRIVPKHRSVLTQTGAP